MDLPDQCQTASYSPGRRAGPSATADSLDSRAANPHSVVLADV